MSSLAASPADQIRRIPDPEVAVPPIALPTLALFGGALALWIASSALYLAGTSPWPVVIAVNAIASFLLFTVSHDSAHNSISSNPAVTTWLGRASTIMFAPHAGFRTWRFIHMQHHLNTNEDERDPDSYAHDGPRWQLPLRWLTIDLQYMVFYLPKLAKRPRAERVELMATWAVVSAVAIACALTGHFVDLLVVYFIPIRLSVLFLAWSFDYLPHAGLEQHRGKDGRFRATRNRIGGERLLSPLLLNQNYHLVHHLHPLIPFYRYVQVWRRSEEDYLANDPALSTVRGRPLTTDEYRRIRQLAEH